MKVKLVVSALALLALFAGSSRAQEDRSKVDVFAGYSYLRFDPNVAGADSFNAHGGSASVAYNVNNWLSGVADFGAYHNGNILNSGVDGTLSTYLFGPRVSVRRFNRVTPFGQVLFGVAHAGASIAGTRGSDNAFAMSVGGGVDIGVSRHFAVRPFQVDYLLTRFNEGTGDARSQNNLRVSTGVVFRF
jgi:outer membrane immunogenic protein